MTQGIFEFSTISTGTTSATTTKIYIIYLFFRFAEQREKNPLIGATPRFTERNTI